MRENKAAGLAHGVLREIVSLVRSTVGRPFISTVRPVSVSPWAISSGDKSVSIACLAVGNEWKMNDLLVFGPVVGETALEQDEPFHLKWFYPEKPRFRQPVARILR